MLRIAKVFVLVSVFAFISALSRAESVQEPVKAGDELVPGIRTITAGKVQELVKTGDELFAKRAEGHEADWANVEIAEKALNSYLKAYESGGKPPELAVKVLKAAYFYGTYAEKDAKKQKEAFAKAVDIGKEALEKNPDDVSLNYQMAGNLGRWGEVNGIMASARAGVADSIKGYAEKVVRLDPAYGEAGGYRTMGRLHFKAPYIPFFLSWPDKKEALKYLRQAVEVGPDNLTNHLFYAESLHKEKSFDEALSHLDRVISAKVNASREVEDLRDKKDAEALRNKILAERGR